MASEGFPNNGVALAKIDALNFQGEIKWVAGLLGNEKAVAPLLKFLKTTGVGGREGASERESEWEWKNDQAGEDLLDKTQEGLTQRS